MSINRRDFLKLGGIAAALVGAAAVDEGVKRLNSVGGDMQRLADGLDYKPEKFWPNNFFFENDPSTLKEIDIQEIREAFSTLGNRTEEALKNPDYAFQREYIYSHGDGFNKSIWLENSAILVDNLVTTREAYKTIMASTNLTENQKDIALDLIQKDFYELGSLCWAFTNLALQESEPGIVLKAAIGGPSNGREGFEILDVVFDYMNYANPSFNHKETKITAQWNNIDGLIAPNQIPDNKWNNFASDFFLNSGAKFKEVTRNTNLPHYREDLEDYVLDKGGRPLEVVVESAHDVNDTADYTPYLSTSSYLEHIQSIKDLENAIRDILQDDGFDRMISRFEIRPPDMNTHEKDAGANFDNLDRSIRLFERDGIIDATKFKENILWFKHAIRHELGHGFQTVIDFISDPVKKYEILAKIIDTSGSYDVSSDFTKLITLPRTGQNIEDISVQQSIQYPLEYFGQWSVYNKYPFPLETLDSLNLMYDGFTEMSLMRFLPKIKNVPQEMQVNTPENCSKIIDQMRITLANCKDVNPLEIFIFDKLNQYKEAIAAHTIDIDWPDSVTMMEKSLIPMLMEHLIIHDNDGFTTALGQIDFSKFIQGRNNHATLDLLIMRVKKRALEYKKFRSSYQEELFAQMFSNVYCQADLNTQYNVTDEGLKPKLEQAYNLFEEIKSYLASDHLALESIPNPNNTDKV